ncbi:hypothetical protein [Haemophilus parainfluenzae]|uniref:Uncharacterized protein n=1 Tax=Haemophilus parainfluenzae TaxID=729 RepID=A0A7M1NV88_HAEPA|nr:hypothetical protein [Haemophilus parainfluenzae]QOR16610.1 hypothetical protein INP94_06890 [Haemophilus parainfluenzae]
MGKFLKLEFVKENVEPVKIKGKSDVMPISSGFEHFTAYLSSDLITCFVECEEIPGDGTSINDDDFSECLETGTALYLSEEGIKVIDDLCDRFYSDMGIVNNTSCLSGVNLVLVTNSIDNIIKQLNGNDGK